MMFKKEDLELIEHALEKYKMSRSKRYSMKRLKHALDEIRKLQRLKVYIE